jgi:TonB-dependent receptor
MSSSTKRASGAALALRAWLLSGAAMGVLGATAAEAQTDAATNAAVSSVEEVVITGKRPIAESEAAALDVQKRSDSLVAVVASDSVGRLPDQNVAQAAGRLPGVAVQRDQGQARYINLRGAPIQWTTLSIDGIAIVSPEGRDTRYDSIPSAIASQIVVRKAVTPDMTGETVSGNVDIKTRSAFDYAGRHVAGKLGGGYVELGKRQEYEGQLVLSDRFQSSMGEFGVLLAGSYYQRDMVTDNFETDWEVVEQDQQPYAADRIWGREAENKLYRLTRKNYSYSGRLDWKPNENNQFYVQSIFTAFSDDEARDNYIYDLDDRQSDNRRGVTPCTVANVSTPANSGYADICIGNTPLKGYVYGVDINQRATLRAFEQSIFTNTLAGEHDFGSKTHLSWRLNYTRAKDDRSVVGEARYDSPSTRNLRPTVFYDFTDPQLARVQLYRTIANANGTFQAGDRITNIDDFQRPLSSLRSLDAVDITEAYTGKFDVTHNTELFGGDTSLQFGGRFDQRTKKSTENELLVNTAAQFAAAGISTTFAPVSLSDAFKGKIPLGYSFRYFDLEAMRANVAKADGVADFTPIPGNYYNVQEQVYAGYAMGTVRYDWGSVLGGVRIEHVKNDGRALVAFGSAFRPVEVANDTTLVFPSLHLNYNIAEDMKLRVSFTSGAARPDYDQLRPNFTYNDANQTASGGNPEAKPERAYGLDAYYEWYVRPQGYVMAGVFYKKVQDVLFDDSRTFGLDVLNSGGVDRSQYSFSTLTNGGSGYIYGLELAFQQQLEPFTEQLSLPGWMGGFGLSANLTLNKSQAEAPDGSKLRLPGASDVVLNLGGYYEKYGLSVRLNYQKRTEWLDTFGAAVDGGAQYWAMDDELDFSARYAVNKNLELYFDASNLLNGPGRRYVRDSQYTIEWERFGRRFTGGVRFNF